MNTTTLTLQQPDSAAMARSADAALSMVESFEVNDATTYELAGEELAAIKKRAAALDEQRKSITRPIDEAKANVMVLFKPPLELLTKAEGILKGKMLAWFQAEQRREQEARRAAEAAAQAERDRLAAEATKLEEQGRAGEAVVQRAVAEMIVAAPPVVQSAAPKLAGVSVRETVDFEVDDLLALVQHVAQHPELIALLQADSVKLRAYVRGLGTACNLPGVRVFTKAGMAASRK